MAEPSGFANIRTDRWRRIDPGRLGLVASIGAVLDTVTTYVILTTPAYSEANVLVAALDETHLLLAMGVFVLFAFGLVTISWLSLGWWSSVAGTYAAFAFVAAGIHNVVGFATSVWLLASLPGPMWMLLHHVIPAVALTGGLAVSRIEYGSIPWREVAAVTAFVLAVAWGMPLLV